MWTLIISLCITDGEFTLCMPEHVLPVSSETSCHLTASEMRRRADEELASRGLVGVFEYECAGPLL